MNIYKVIMNKEKPQLVASHLFMVNVKKTKNQ